MAIFHCQVKMIGRSSGRSSVGAAAYRAGELLKNEHDGVTHDYSRKIGVEHSEILLPKQAPREYLNRGKLWNAVEASEKSKNAQTAREVELALPTELGRQQQIDVVRDYIKENFVNKGMCADFSIHDKRDGNPHAHVMLTTRPINDDGTWGAKQRKEYILDKHGNRQYDAVKKTYKCNSVRTHDWDNRDNVERWRERWADVCNHQFKLMGINERIDHRTLEAQGIDREPTIHKGAAAHQMEKRGVFSERVQINTEITERNIALSKDKKDLEQLREDLRSRAKLPEVGSELRSTSKTTAAASTTPILTEAPAATVAPIGDQDQGEPVAPAMTKEQIQKKLELVTKIAEKMENSYTRIQNMNNGIERLQMEIDSLGVFDGKKKRQLVEKKEGLVQSRDKAVQKFRETFKREPSYTPEAIRNLKRQTADLQRQLTPPKESLMDKLKRNEKKVKEQNQGRTVQIKKDIDLTR